MPGDNVLVHWLFFPSFAELYEFILSLILQHVQVHLNANTKSLPVLYHLQTGRGYTVPLSGSLVKMFEEEYWPQDESLA